MKFDGAFSETPGLRLLIRGDDDDRNDAQDGVALHSPENFHAGDHRHHQIQKHQRQGFLLLAADFQSFSPSSAYSTS